MPAKKTKGAKDAARPKITVAGAFMEAQLSLAKHRKCCEALRAVRAESEDAAAFDDDFFSCVACLLPVYKREPAAERVVDFVVQFATKHGGETALDEDFVQPLCLRLLKLSAAKDKAVRFRVTQLVGRIMNSMAEEAEVSDELFEAVEEAMVVRCRDKVPLVRAWALRALFRLQNPLDASDEITVELLRLMATDGSKEVRMAAISTVAPSKHSIKAILARTRDVSEEVRLHALGVLAGKVEVRWLSISQRASLLQTGLQDRQPKVRESCAQLLVGSWLRKLDNQPLQLLKALDVATYPEAADLALEALLADKGAAPLVAAAAEGWGALGPEAALCLRARLHQLAAVADEAGLEAARPELGTFCERLQAAVEATQTRGPAAGAGAAKGGAGSGSSGAEEYTLAQLLCAAEHLDMADEHGRAQLEGLLGALLKELATSAELLPQLMRGLEAACGGEAERYQRLVLELIAEVEDPLEAGELGEASGADPAEAAAQLQREEETMLADNKAFELRAELAAAVAEEDFDRAATLKQEVAALQQRLEALREATAAMTPEHERLRRSMRCLQLAELLLQAPSLRLREDELAHLLERLVPALQSHHAELRALAMRCVSLYAHTAHAAALRFWPLLLKALRHDVQLVQLAALHAVVDLLHLHGPAALLPTAPPAAAPPAAAPAAPQESAHAAEAARLLLPLLEQPPGALRSAAAVGVAKLLHAGRVVSSHLLSRLLLLYFEPVEMESPEPEAQAEQASPRPRAPPPPPRRRRPAAAAPPPLPHAPLHASPPRLSRPAAPSTLIEPSSTLSWCLVRRPSSSSGLPSTSPRRAALWPPRCCPRSAPRSPPRPARPTRAWRWRI